MRSLGPDELANKFIRVFSDNTCTVNVINSLFSRSDQLRSVIAEVLGMLCNWHSTMEAFYIPGDLNLIADYLSRVSLRTARLTHSFF